MKYVMLYVFKLRLNTSRKRTFGRPVGIAQLAIQSLLWQAVVLRPAHMTIVDVDA